MGNVQTVPFLIWFQVIEWLNQRCLRQVLSLHFESPSHHLQLHELPKTTQVVGRTAKNASLQIQVGRGAYSIR